MELQRPHRKDLTNEISGVTSRGGVWTRNEVLCALSSVCRAEPNTTSDWDEGAGEGWARILRGDEVIAYVCAWLPWVIARQNVARSAEKSVPEGAQVLEVADMDDADFMIDLDTLERVYGRPITPIFNPRCFSINDLWYATV